MALYRTLVQHLTDLFYCGNRRGTGQVCFVLLDLQMPVLDGFCTARILRAEHGASLPILACTAADLSSTSQPCLPGGKTVQQHALDSGVDLCLSKPMLLTELKAALQKLHIMIPQQLTSVAGVSELTNSVPTTAVLEQSGTAAVEAVMC